MQAEPLPRIVSHRGLEIHHPLLKTVVATFGRVHEFGHEPGVEERISSTDEPLEMGFVQKQLVDTGVVEVEFYPRVDGYLQQARC